MVRRTRRTGEGEEKRERGVCECVFWFGIMVLGVDGMGWDGMGCGYGYCCTCDE
jgi:hypothetical protein